MFIIDSYNHLMDFCFNVKSMLTQPFLPFPYVEWKAGFSYLESF